jgi:hypothetical protein
MVNYFILNDKNLKISPHPPPVLIAYHHNYIQYVYFVHSVLPIPYKCTILFTAAFRFYKMMSPYLATFSLKYCHRLLFLFLSMGWRSKRIYTRFFWPCFWIHRDPTKSLCLPIFCQFSVVNTIFGVNNMKINDYINNKYANFCQSQFSANGVHNRFS